ncbi:MAG: hypothetical protein HWE22_13815 [Flavobacteriales bacterium]|nr:hypothetical protein [Flavobacteriales bacterium]
MIWILIIGLILIGLIGFIYVRNFMSLRPKDDGFEYVLVKDDGSVWELEQEDQEYLTEEFHPNDGARPYIKSRYDQLTPDGRIGGFIPRRRVPRRIKINK